MSVAKHLIVLPPAPEGRRLQSLEGKLTTARLHCLNILQRKTISLFPLALFTRMCNLQFTSTSSDKLLLLNTQDI